MVLWIDESGSYSNLLTALVDSQRSHIAQA
ncbi:hypothetical protein PSP31120_01821 [Pandoraea sputorum]|nr:hypothetical protein PSP31120_01821 [Pandoraea sputorum]